MMSASTRRARRYPLSTLRTLALHAQGLDRAGGTEPEPTGEAIAELVKCLGCLQMDTLQMVRRCHYLTVWSRLGCYEPSLLDGLVYDPTQRVLFEGWRQHAVCLVPLRDWRYQLPHMRRVREKPSQYTTNWLRSEENRKLVELALARVRAEGPVRVSHFEYHGPRRGSWWDWKPAKMALEHLYAIGDLMISNRVNFQREYDLTERVLPSWVDVREPTAEERDRFWLEQAALALGPATPAQLAWFYYMTRARARPQLEALQKQKILLPIEGIIADGQNVSFLIHRDLFPLLEKAADGALRAQRTTFLNPFDNFFWAKGRDLAFWGFKQALETYKPAAQRIWGYYCLPILHRDRLIGRFDPKLERTTGTLILRSLYLEEGVEPEEELVSAVAQAMRDFLRFHQAQKMIIERSDPPDFGKKLSRAVELA